MEVEKMNIEPEQPRPVQGMQTHAKGMRDLMGPFMVDQAIRQAITHCWMMLPEEQRSAEKVEQEMQRLVQRALEDFKEDVASFGFASPE
jgi:hypothetical protein